MGEGEATTSGFVSQAEAALFVLRVASMRPELEAVSRRPQCLVGRSQGMGMPGPEQLLPVGKWLGGWMDGRTKLGVTVIHKVVIIKRLPKERV